MVNVLAPDFTIETVEIVIVSRNFTGLKCWPWLDHVVAILTSGNRAFLGQSKIRARWRLRFSLVSTEVMSRVGVILRPGMARRDSLCISSLISMAPTSLFTSPL
jgi:hypothetical protein